MADQDIPVQRISFFPIPIILSVLDPTENDQTERIMLLNPLTQGIVVLHGDASLLAAALGGGPPPASKASIDALKTVSIEENDRRCEESECVVCLEGLFEREDEVSVKEMPCGHRYHGDCIEKWLKMHGSCPMCRYSMPPEESEEEEKKTRAERSEEGRNSGIWVSISFGRRNNDHDADAPAQRSD